MEGDFYEKYLRFGLIWGQLTILKKKSWASYEQLLRVILKYFQAQKKWNKDMENVVSSLALSKFYWSLDKWLPIKPWSVSIGNCDEETAILWFNPPNGWNSTIVSWSTICNCMVKVTAVLQYCKLVIYSCTAELFCSEWLRKFYAYWLTILSLGQNRWKYSM